MVYFALIACKCIFYWYYLEKLNVNQRRLKSLCFLLCTEQSRNDYVLFQAASTIKEAILREWTILDKADIESLRSFLLTFVTHKHGWGIKLIVVCISSMIKGDNQGKTDNKVEEIMWVIKLLRYFLASQILLHEFVTALSDFLLHLF